jgi:hypothetical protein
MCGPVSTDDDDDDDDDDDGDLRARCPLIARAGCDSG